MVKLRKDIGMLILCIGIYFLIICGLTPVFIPKGVEVDAVSPMITFQTFYDMEPHSIEVLFLGTSHAYNGLSPQVLMDEYGIESYNLASSMQSTIMSYYWLKEALRTQQPKVVVFDVFNMIPYGYAEPEDNYWNSREGQLRRSIDWMKISDNKISLMKEVSSKDSRIGMVSLLMPILRYHERWETLTDEDLFPHSLDYLKSNKGYKPVVTTLDKDPGYVTFSITGLKEQDANYINEINKKGIITDYTDRMAELCREEGISLLLIRTPYCGANAAEFCMISEYAEKIGCEYVDFNEEKTYKDLGYDFINDSTDMDHANINGAIKLTHYIGQMLQEHYNL